MRKYKMTCMVHSWSINLAAVMWAGMIGVSLLQVVPSGVLSFDELYEAFLVQR